MAITTFGELKTAVANYLNRSDLTSRIPEFVSLAEDRIYTDPRVRIRAMETTTDLTVSAQNVALPTRYIAARRLYLDGSPIRRLNYIDPVNFWSTYLGSETSKPEAFTIEGENFVFGPAPDDSYTGKLLYYQRLAALSADSDTNWFLTNARGLYLYGTLIEAEPYIRNDPRMMTWAQMFEEAVENVIQSDKRDRFSGGILEMRSEVPVT